MSTKGGNAMGFLSGIPRVNLQAFAAVALFVLSLFISRIVVNIGSGKWPGGAAFLFYLRMLLGFVFAASIALGIYSFMGICVI